MPDIYHRVGRGDTISQIAQRYGVSMSSLVELNGLNSRNFIRAGQVLRLPGNGATTPVTLAKLDGTAQDTSTYIVRSGDSVALIARRFGVAEDVLLALNGISDRNRIFAGQELRIAGGEAFDSMPVVALAEDDAAPLAAESPAVEDALRTVAAPLASAAAGLSHADEQRLLAAEATLAMLIETEDDEETEIEVLGGGSGAQGGDEEAAGEEVAAADETSLEANVLASQQAEMAADPSDYLVAPDSTIEVQAQETLGHYADWLQVRTQRLRDINGLPFGQAVVIGERLRLDFANVDAATFEQRRMAYQQSTQEAFFLAYQITDTVEHVIRPGESLWVLALRRYRVPVWLVRQFNPDLDLDQINPGIVVKFPELRPISAPETPAQAANDG
jgi:membrane-bound lytic murein transglycosylase D